MVSARLAPIDGEQFGLDEAAHLMRRTVIGARGNEALEAYEMGLEGTLQLLCKPHTPDYHTIEHLVGGLVNSEVSPNDSPRSIAYFSEKNGRYTDFRQWWCRTVIDAPPSLQERLVLMWHMHFATSCGGAHYAEHTFDQNEMIRKHVFGSMQSLTNDVTLGLAMQAYLDGVVSFWTDYRYCINENHARELMELHLFGHVGRNGKPVYNQTDVVALSRALSGQHIVESWSDNADDGTKSLWRERSCKWRLDRCYPHTNELFGTTGRFTPYEVIPLVFKNRTNDIAWWFARRLCTEFVAMTQEVDADDVDDVAALILEREWDMTSVLSTLLSSKMFFDPRYRMRLVRSPAHLLLGMLRSFRATHITDFISDVPRDACDLIVRLQRLGHLPYAPPNVSGWRRDLDWLTATDTVARIDMCRRFGMGTLTYMDEPDAFVVMRYDPIGIAREYAEPNNLEQLCERVATILLGSNTQHIRESLQMVALQGMQRNDWNPEANDYASRRGIRRMFTHALSAPRYQLM